SREVTSDPYTVDTDADGLDDYLERVRASDPRRIDGDFDQISDADEHYIWFTSPIHQDSDGDGLIETREIKLFKTSPILADTDGDGFDDRREVLEMNRNPRLADLPQPELTVGDMRLQIDERYTFTDQEGQTVSEESSSSSTLSRSQSTKFSRSDTRTTENLIEASAKIGYKQEFETSESAELGGKIGFGSKQTTTFSGEAAFKGSHKWGSTTQVDSESARASQQAYEDSMSKGRTYTTTSTVTRQVFGASVDTGLTLGNAGDIAFTLSNVEVSVLQPGRIRGEFVPVATLLPGSELLGGGSAVFNLLPMEERGPIIFSNREVFPNLVEDLMRAPRGLIFKVTYFDVTDEFGRNLAYITQDVFERTAMLTVDPGDGTFKRYYIATNGGMDTEGYAGGGLVGGFDEDGVARGIPMDFVLQDILGLPKNPQTPNAIIAGYNGVADTVAEAGDIQAVPPGTTGLPDRTAVVLAGQNGVLDTLPNNVNPLGDDRPAVTTGYETSPTCGAQTDPRIIEPEFDDPELGGDGVADTKARGDDVQEVPLFLCDGDAQPCDPDADCPDGVCRGDGTGAFMCAGGDNDGQYCDPDAQCPGGTCERIIAEVEPGQVIVSAGPNGLLETVARGDDVYAGPGDLCDDDDDCPGGSCTGNEAVVRFENSAAGDPNRFWVVFSSAEIPIGTDFGDFLLKPDEAITLAFGQDIDRDGLFAREEFIYGSSDRMKDTDEEGLGDFAEIRVGWKVKVAGRADLQVYPAPTLEDSDFDDLGDEVEKECRTDPRTRDTDGDGMSDSEEIAYGRCCTDNTGQSCQSDPAVPCQNLVLNGEFDTGQGYDADHWNRSHSDAHWNRWESSTARPGWDGNPGCFILNETTNKEPEVWQIISPLQEDATYTVTGYYKTYQQWSAGPSIAALVDDDLVWEGGHQRIDYWEPFSFEFTAAREQVKLTFKGQVGSDSAYFIDGIRVTGCSGEFAYCYAARSEVCRDADVHDMPYPPKRLDPRNADTDGDAVPDALEIDLGSNPLDPADAEAFRDTDLDGLTDQEERDGWEVTVHECDRPACTPAVTTDWCRNHPECTSGENLVQNGEFDEGDGHDAVGWFRRPQDGDAYFRWEDRTDPEYRGWDGRPGIFILNHSRAHQVVELAQWIRDLHVGATYVVSGYYKSVRWNGGPSFAVSLENEDREDVVVYSAGHQYIEDWTPFGFVFTVEAEVGEGQHVDRILAIKGQVGSNSDYFIDGIGLEEACRCYSNPLEGDSDFDGLPDYLERELATNPQDDDTDCDGLVDYDEFDEFGSYMNLTYEFPAFYLSGSNSQQLGTDPTSQDTDGDRLPDEFEQYDGWRVLTCTDDAPREVMSNPLWWDSDLDGLSDLEEYLGNDRIDPSVPRACDAGPRKGRPCDTDLDCAVESECRITHRWCGVYRACDCHSGAGCGLECPSSFPGCYLGHTCVRDDFDPCEVGEYCTVQTGTTSYCAEIRYCHGGPNDGEQCADEADCNPYACQPPTPDATDPSHPDTDGDG
ncbi:MAG: hypothetical protein JSU86_04605, partial [Phycisphaerales bacterium]